MFEPDPAHSLSFVMEETVVTTDLTLSYALSFFPLETREKWSDRHHGLDRPRLPVVEDLDRVNGHLLPDLDLGYVWFPPQ